MAEIAVINSVIANLVPLLKEEAKLLRGVRRDASSLIAELEMIKPFLRKADERAERGELDDGQKVWMKQVREVFYQIEDAIDEYILHLARHPQQHGFIGFFSKVTRFIKKLKARHDIASEIQEIKSTIRQIKERGETYGFSTVGQGSSGGSGNNIEWYDPRVASHFIDEDEVVGIESQRNELVSWLVEGSPKRVSISVVGMGGSGKTTLTNKVYEDTTVNSHFGFLAWIEVSQSYKKEEILKAIIKQFLQDMEMKWSAPDQEMDRMNLKALIKKLRDYLDAKRYVIFFDDVWDQEFWNFIKHALPDKNKGNRVVITTRYVDVAASCKESQFDHVQTLQPLPQEKAWELFCKKAFQADFGGICPSNLKDLSRDILKRCEGLPLAIVTIGGVLATKDKVIHQWQAFSNSLGSELGSNPRFKGTKRVLSLNYLDLPYHLQLCYLYFGIIPSGYSISRTKLIRLWIAEGLVLGKGGKTLEEIGEEYLTELKHRNLVQMSYVDFGRKVRCRVHDIMREIILLISYDLGFCSISSKENSGVESFHGLTRRFSIHNYADNSREGITGSRIRSFFCFDKDVLPDSFVRFLFSNFKLLKVLDFEDAPLHSLPKGVGDLIHLSYLSVKNTKIKILPKSIGRLQNLMTLNLKKSLVCELPLGINRLYKLRYLLAYYWGERTENGFLSQRGVKIQKGFGCLKALWELSIVQADHGSGLIKEIRELTELRKLGIDKLKREDGKALCTAIMNMSKLKSLDVSSISEDEILDLQHISCPPQFLQCLYLSGRLEKFPYWISKLEHVVIIQLNDLHLKENPLKLLQALPNLLKLRLYAAYDGDHLYFEKGGFQKLKELELISLNALSSMIIDNGALPLLQTLCIRFTPQLKEVPSGIQHLKNITFLRFIGMPEEFICKMLPDEGQDYEVVKHIPMVLITCQDELEHYHTYALGQVKRQDNTYNIV